MTTEFGTGQEGLNHWEPDGKNVDCFSDRETGVKDKAHEVGLYKQENRSNIWPKLFSTTFCRNLNHLRVVKYFDLTTLSIT
jgi:hypothetical protein